MKLYKLKNGIGDWFVFATDPTVAEEKLMKHLNAADYGTTSNREVSEIHIVASKADDNRFLTGHFLLV